MDDLILKNRIKEHRGRLNITQDELSKRIEVDRMTINNIETGKTTPSIITGLLIAEAFSVSVNEVFEINK
jgi:putative transcriptional regulator